MPRPATPKPGFSILRLNSSKNPHLVKKLDYEGRTHLINSVAQDIEACIWAVGYYTRDGVLDAANTFEFDQILNDIHLDERLELRNMLERMIYKAGTFRKQAKLARRKLKRLRAKQRERRAEERKVKKKSKGMHYHGSSIDFLAPPINNLERSFPDSVSLIRVADGSDPVSETILPDTCSISAHCDEDCGTSQMSTTIPHSEKHCLLPAEETADNPS